jgi:hypothetical protein
MYVSNGGETWMKGEDRWGEGIGEGERGNVGRVPVILSDEVQN